LPEEEKEKVLSENKELLETTPDAPIEEEPNPNLLSLSQDPFRGREQTSYSWLERAFDPESPITEDGRSIYTMSAFDTESGQELLFPTIRLDKDTGKLVQYDTSTEEGKQEAYEKSIVEDDYLTFANQEEATAFSKNVSDRISNIRESHKKQQEQYLLDQEKARHTPALLPDEVIQKYHQIEDLMVRIAGNELQSFEGVQNLITAIEDQTHDFNVEDGDFAEIDLLRKFPSLVETDENGTPKSTTLLEELERRFPDTNSPPGANLLKNYLKEKWLEENRSMFSPQTNPITATWKVAGKLKKLGIDTLEGYDKFMLDLPNIGGNVGYSTVEFMMLVAEGILNPPGLRPMTNNIQIWYEKVEGLAPKEARKEAEKLSSKIFQWSTYVGEQVQPKTELGKAVAQVGEYTLGAYGGKQLFKWGFSKLLKWGKTLEKTKIKEWGREIGKIKPTDWKSLEKIGLSDKTSFTVGGTAGLTAAMSPENRLLPFLEDIGMPPEIARITAASPDDTTFMKYMKNFYDASADVMGFDLVVPGLLAFSRAMYYWAKPYSAESIKKAKEGLNVASSYFDKIKWLFPEEAAFRKPRKVTGAEETLASLKETSQKELQELLEADKKGELLELLNSKGYTVDEKGLVVPKELVPKGKPSKIDTIEIPDSGIKDESLIAKELTNEDKLRIAELAIKDAKDFSTTTQSILNVNKITTEKDRVQYIKKGVEIFDQLYQKGKKRTTQTFQDAERIRREIEAWVGPDNMGSYLQKFAGMTKNFPALMHSVRTYMFEEAKAFAKSSKRITDLGPNATNKDLAEYFLDVYKYVGAMETDVRISGNIARTLQIRNTVLNASDNVLANVIDGAARYGESGRKTLLQVAEAAGGQSDPLGLANLVNRRKGPLYNLFENAKINAISGFISNGITLAATNVGVVSFLMSRQHEHISEIMLNTIAREWRDRTGKKFLGLQGEGMTWGALKAEHFGLQQATFELFAGAHFGPRSPLGSAYKAGKTLQVDSMAHHELSDTFRASGEVIHLPWVGEVALSRGMTAEVFGDYLDTAFMKGDIGSVMKLLVNSAGLINSASGRAIVMTDAFWRNVSERMELHKFAYIDATNTVRNNLRNTDGTLKITDKDAYLEAVQEEYMYIIKNPDDDLLKRAKANTQVALMQAPLNKLGTWVEKQKNFTSDYRGGKDWYETGQGSFGKNLQQSVKNIGENVGKGAVNIAGNIPRAFVASKFAFLRTMTNIFKEYVIERTPFKFLDPDMYKKMSEAERQASLAKIGNGTMILGMGYTLGRKFFMKDGEGFYMEGLDTSDPSSRFVKYVEGGRNPEINYQDGKGNEYSVSLDRIDPGKATLALGAIFGDYHDQMQEAISLMDEKFQKDAIEKEQVLREKLTWALADWFYGVPMMQGIKDTAGAMLQGIDPYGPDLTREGAKFATEFLNPWVSTQSSLRKAIHKTLSPFAVMGSKSEKLEKVKTIDDAKYMDDRGGERDDLREWNVKKGGALFTALNNYIEAVHKVSIMDRTDIRNPKIGQNLYALVGPEGNMVKHLPHLKLRSLERGLATLLLPIIGKRKIRTNTSDLILGLDIPYKDPRQWQATPGIVLSPEQRYTWAVLAGRMNKKYFNNEYYRQSVELLNKGGLDDIHDPKQRRIKARLKDRVHSRILLNRQRAYKSMMNLKRNIDNGFKNQDRNQSRINKLTTG